MPPEFLADRAEFLGRPLDPARLRAMRPMMLDQLRAHHEWLGWMLADGRPFLMGAEPSLVDLAAYHPVWFLRGKIDPATPGLAATAALQPWADRVAAIGHGAPTELGADAAIAIAAAAEPEPVTAADDTDEPSGRKPGAPVTVTPDDTGKVPVKGVLVASNAQEIIIARHDPQVGTVHVHFPRAGYVVQG
jgi:glutathione S-transferase